MRLARLLCTCRRSTHLTKGQMMAGSAVHEALASQASEPTTTGFSVNRLRNQMKEVSCRYRGDAARQVGASRLIGEQVAEPDEGGILQVQG